MLLGVRSELAAWKALFALHEEGEFAVQFTVIDQLVASLSAKRLEIANRTWIGCRYAENLATSHLSKRFLGFQDRERTMQTPRVQIFLEFHMKFHRYEVKNERLILPE